MPFIPPTSSLQTSYIAYSYIRTFIFLSLRKYENRNQTERLCLPTQMGRHSLSMNHTIFYYSLKHFYLNTSPVLSCKDWSFSLKGPQSLQARTAILTSKDCGQDLKKNKTSPASSAIDTSTDSHTHRKALYSISHVSFVSSSPAKV